MEETETRSRSVTDMAEELRKLQGKTEFSQADVDFLVRVSRKVEIAGRVYCYYSRGSWSPRKEKGLISDGELQSWLRLFVAAYEMTGQLRFLNTAFKGLNSGMLSSHPEIETDIRMCAQKSLDRISCENR